MLKYFISTTEALITAAIIVGLITSCSGSVFGKKGRISAIIGIIAGLVSAGVMAYMKNATNKIDTSLWNFRIFVFSLCSLVLFFIFCALRKPMKKAGEIIPPVFLMIILAAAILYALPDVIAYPYTILLTESTILSTGFIFKFIGIIFGIVLVLLAGIAVGKAASGLGSRKALLFTNLVLVSNAVRQITVCLRTMLTKKMIISGVTVSKEVYKKLFSAAKFSSNYDSLFIYITIIISAFIPVLLWIRSLNAKEPYSNPAEHRKIKKKWKVSRQWAVLAVFCLVFSAVNMKVLKPLTNKAVELSPVEETTERDGNVYISFEQVEDGHLHRFGYKTQNGVEIRFIVIKKPNSSSYGIGLDACDICGETGYYEKDGQVVCKLCDVVMNINTIGFKGGCNPIVIPYSLENGNIIVPAEGLMEYEHEFK